jgi:hypothetical protein
MNAKTFMVPDIAPTPPGWGEHLWRMMQAQIAHCAVSNEFMGYQFGTMLDLRDTSIEFGLRVYCTDDRRFILRTVVEDIEDFKYGGRSVHQKFYSDKGRALIAYGMAKYREMISRGLLPEVGR